MIKKIFLVLMAICQSAFLNAQNCDLSATENRRYQINSISEPYSFLVQMTMHRGKSYNGTAFFIHPRVLLTAGHNLRKRPQFYFTRVKAITLRVGATSPIKFITHKKYKTTQNENIYTLKSFNKNYSIYEDYGIIILPDDELYSKIGNHFRLTVYDPNILNDVEINIAGYPGDKDYCTLWADKTKNYFTYINPSSNPNRYEYLKYDFATETGVSGSPVWFNQNGQSIVFAIHTYGNNNDDKKCNTATLITQAVYNDITQFCSSKGIDITK